MRLFLLAFVMFFPGLVLEATAQSAAPRATLAAYVPTEAEAAVSAARHVVQAQLGEQAEQCRLKALAHLGLGKPAAARREAERLIQLVPGYKSQPSDPAAFAALVLDVQEKLAAGAQKKAIPLATRLD